MEYIPVLCLACTRYQTGRTCTSFPDETIPDTIILYGGDHRDSLDGEPPFEPDPAKQEEYEDWLVYSGLG